VLPSDRSPVVLMNASSVKATNSLITWWMTPTTQGCIWCHGEKAHTDRRRCYQRIRVRASGDITAGFRLDADVMPDTEYTFVHLTKYRDPATHLQSGSPMQISFLASTETVPVSITRVYRRRYGVRRKCMEADHRCARSHQWWRTGREERRKDRLAGALSTQWAFFTNEPLHGTSWKCCWPR
jgi:hypothetical protein